MQQNGVAEKRDNLFATTRWSLVLDADASSMNVAHGALTELCQIYWRPLYLFLRRRGFDQEQAQDLTQGFFAELIRTRSYLRGKPEKGRFRSFLLGALKHFVAHAQERDRSQKRGGDVTFVPITEADVVDAEKNQHRMDGDVELLYEREWAAALLRRTNERLEQECAVAGKARLLAHLKPHLTADGANDYQALSQTLGRPVATLRSDVGRFRARYRAILREEVAGTVQSPSDIDDELRYLFKVVAATG